MKDKQFHWQIGTWGDLVKDLKQEREVVLIKEERRKSNKRGTI